MGSSQINISFAHFPELILRKIYENCDYYTAANLSAVKYFKNI